MRIGEHVLVNGSKHQVTTRTSVKQSLSIMSDRNDLVHFPPIAQHGSRRVQSSPRRNSVFRDLVHDPIETSKGTNVNPTRFSIRIVVTSNVTSLPPNSTYRGSTVHQGGECRANRERANHYTSRILFQGAGVSVFFEVFVTSPFNPHQFDSIHVRSRSVIVGAAWFRRNLPVTITRQCSFRCNASIIGSSVTEQC